MFQQQDRKKKFLGSVLGSFVGDALGYIIKGQNQATSKEYVKCIDSFKVLEYGRAYNTKLRLYGPVHSKDRNNYIYTKFEPYGQYSDHSRMIRETLITIYESNGVFSYDNYGKKISAITANCLNEYSKVLSPASNRINLGISYNFSGIPNLISNESAVRSSIFGLLFSNNEQHLIEVAANQSMITHMTSECAAGAVCISVFVAMAYTNTKVNPDHFLRKASECVKTINSTFAQHLLHLINMVKLPPTTVYPIIRNIKDAAWNRNALEMTTNVFSSVLWSLYCFLKHPDNFMNAIYEGIAVGGSVNEVAAMIGAISGAYLGIDKIPRQFMLPLNDRGRYKGEDIYKIAEQIYNGAQYVKTNVITKNENEMEIVI